MRSTTLFILSTSFLTSTLAFSSLLSTKNGSNNSKIDNMKLKMNRAFALAEVEHQLEMYDERFLQKKLEVYDPLGIYPQYSPERLFDSVQPLKSSSSSSSSSSLEQQQDETTITKDPLNIYLDKSQLTSDVVMSTSLPFLKRPKNLNGRLPGDIGFDPLHFSNDISSLNWYRESEIKHGRVAMLATVGWVVSELTHNNIASTLGLDQILGSSNQAPTIFNGHLSEVNPLFWIDAFCVAAVIEFLTFKKGDTREQPGTFSFDPFQIISGKSYETKLYVQESEIFNGRLAMLAITGCIIQELTTQDAVINHIPIFFNTISNVVAHHF